MNRHTFQDHPMIQSEDSGTSSSGSGVPPAVEARRRVVQMPLTSVPSHRPDQQRDSTSLQSTALYSNHHAYSYQMQTHPPPEHYPLSSSHTGLPFNQPQTGQPARMPYGLPPAELYRYGSNTSVQPTVEAMNQTLPFYTLSVPNNTNIHPTIRAPSEVHQSHASDDVPRILPSHPRYYQQHAEPRPQLTVPSSTAGPSGTLLSGGSHSELAEYADRHHSGQACFYKCRIEQDGKTCNMWIIGDRPYIAKHLRSCHPSQPANGYATCHWDGCTTVMKKDNLARHIVTHLNIKWKCPHCQEEFSRDDAVHRHLERVASGTDQVPEVIHSGNNLPLV